MASAVGATAPVRRQAADDEQALVERVRRGDPEAFNQLVRRYARRAFAIAYRVLRHTQDAEDLVQDAFMAALDAIGSFDPTRPFAPWFFRIVVNRSLNAASARSTRERHVTVVTVDQLRTNDASAAAADPAESSEIRTRFQAALATLPEHQRLIVELSDIDGRSSTEIGEMLNLPRGTVRWHLHQARKTLRVALASLARLRHPQAVASPRHAPALPVPPVPVPVSRLVLRA
jgi:RNA polymerase sigma-70 factor (ECF subfamily)